MSLSNTEKSEYKLSAVIVSYNEAEYLREAIDSCLNQRFSYPYEIIIGDDGSDDGSIDIIRDYAEKYPDTIKYFVMDRSDVDKKTLIPSFRVSNVMKRAFEMSKGEYISVLSGDDLFIDMDMWQRDVEYLEEHKDLSACFSQFKYFWNDGTERFHPFPDYSDNASFWSGCYVHISCFVFRRNCLDNLLDRFCDDTGLCFSILKTGKVHYIKSLVFAYRQRDRSIMHEADPVELSMLELLLLQDNINRGGYYYRSLMRCRDHFIRIMRSGISGEEDRYKKYVKAAAEYPNNIIDLMIHYRDYGFIKRTGIALKYLGLTKLMARITRRRKRIPNKDMIVVSINGDIHSQMISYAVGAFFMERGENVKYDISEYTTGTPNTTDKKLEIRERFPDLYLPTAYRLERNIYRKLYSINEGNLTRLDEIEVPAYLTGIKYGHLINDKDYLKFFYGDDENDKRCMNG